MGPHIPETRYAKTGDLHIAYQVVGSGPPDIVFVHGWISHIELMWEEPRMARFLERLASIGRLIVMDKRGTGLSDPVALSELPTIEQRVEDLLCVLDAVGSEECVYFGTSEAGAMGIVFAASHPGRAAGLVLLNSYARLAHAPDYPQGIPDEASSALFQAIEQGWGQGVALEALVASQSDSPEVKRWWARYQRMAASPGAAVALLRNAFQTDARSVLPAVSVPTLILHRSGDPFTGPEHGRYLADHIPGARYVELTGVDHLFFAEDLEVLLGEVQEFLTGTREASDYRRVLATLMFADIVSSTQRAAEIGDKAWGHLLTRYHAAMRQTLPRFRGRVIDTVGDGLFAAFDGPASAIRCAHAISSTAATLELGVRFGVHTGECEVVESGLGGIAVHTAARIADGAGPGEVLVSRTVKDLTAGSGIRFVERGVRELKGIPGEWPIFAASAT